MRRVRTEIKTRKVPRTIGETTYMVDEEYRADLAVSPFDLDNAVARLLTFITSIVVLGAMTWSTAAIGDLLSRMAPAWVSYLVAVIFDLSWVACMAAEWLMRYDPKKARIPRAAGWAALMISVGAIATDGVYATHALVIGTAGGMISVLAKGLWMVVLLISTRRLNPLDQQAYEQAMSAAGADLALNTVQRRLMRMRARALQERRALGMDVIEYAPTAPHIAATEPFEMPRVKIPKGKHQQIVYFVRNGDRVKIGTTSNLRKRVQSLSLRTGDVLLALNGGQKREQSLHARFRTFRIADTEWFSFVPEIRAYITEQSPGDRIVPELPTAAPASVPAISPAVRMPIRNMVEVRISSGTTDPAEIFNDITGSDPTVNHESVRRIIRTVRREHGL